MEGKQGDKGRAPGGSPGESSFLKHLCHQGVTPGYTVESPSGTRTWWTRNHNRQVAVVGLQSLVWRTTGTPVWSRGVKGSEVVSKEAIRTDQWMTQRRLTVAFRAEIFGGTEGM